MSIAFEKASQSFLVSLKSGGKALNTVRNYTSDLESLKEFLKTNRLDFKSLSLVDLDNYHLTLKAMGLKANSRRRKLMTAKTFLRYMSAHIDLSTVGSDKMIPPEKVEKPPRLVALSLVEEVIQSQPSTDIGVRNRALIYALLESGALVTEILSLKKTDLVRGASGATLTIRGGRARRVSVGPKAAQALTALKECLPKQNQVYFFYGYTRGGPNPEKLSTRGVEVLFKAWSKKFGSKHLKPRMMRHVYVVKQLLLGKTEAEVMLALGLRTPYLFRIYRPLLTQTTPEVEELRNSLL